MNDRVMHACMKINLTRSNDAWPKPKRIPLHSPSNICKLWSARKDAHVLQFFFDNSHISIPNNKDTKFQFFSVHLFFLDRLPLTAG
jgi:hypothetical protein